MKKFLILAAILLLLPFQVFAGQTVTSIIIPSTTLDADPTSVSGTAKIKSADKVAFFVRYDETQVGGISAAVTLQVSDDNSTWLAASFYDYAGGSTLQTSETLSADGNYILWMDRNLVMPYVKLIVTATGSDADDTAIVSARMITQE